MDYFCTTIVRLLGWCNTRTVVPVAWAQHDETHTLATSPLPYLELIHVLRGRFTLHVRERSSTVEAGDIALVNAHFGNHAELTDPRIRYECVSLTIAGDRELADCGHSPLLETRHMADPALVHEHYVRVIRQHWAPPTATRPYRLKAETLALLSVLFDQAIDGGGARVTPDARRVERVLAYVQEHYGDPDLGLTQMARVADVSVAHLCRLFKRRTKLTPIGYVERLRIDQAAELLTRTALDIKRVAYTIGYRDQLYFSRVFRKHLGVCPSRYRAPA